MSMTLTSENVRKTLRETEAKAAQAFADAEKLKADMIESGVDPLKDTHAFAKVDDAYKAYSLLADEASQMKAQLDRMAEIDGYSARRQGQSLRPYSGEDHTGGPSAQRRPERMGHRFANSEQYKSLRAAGAFNTDAAFRAQLTRGFDTPVELMSAEEVFSSMEFLATTVTGGGATSAGPFVQNDLMPGFIPYARKRPIAASLVGQGTTDSDVVEYVTQSAPTDAVAETAEDTAASESTYAFATNTTNVKEITHFVPVTLRAMADYGQIRSIIENELAAGVIDRLDTQIISGNGSGQNLTGIYNASSIGAQALGGDNRPDAIHKAMTVIRIAAGVLSEPDAIGMYPNDWQKVRLEKDSNGQYLFGGPGMAGDRQIFGVPVVSSTVFTSGTPLVGDFGGSARIWYREGLSVTSGLDGNDFTKRRVSLLAAMRIAFVVTRAGGFCTVTGF